jgi:hypothetical protein
MIIKTEIMLVVLMMSSMIFSSCVVLSDRQVAHISDVLSHNEMEVRRGEAMVSILNGSDNEIDQRIIRFIQQRNEIIRNNNESIRITVGIDDRDSEEGSGNGTRGTE